MTQAIYQDPQRYYDSYSESYDQVRQGAYHQVVAEITRPFLLRYVPSEGRALDLGCGTGRTMEWLRTHSCSVVGMDLSKAMVSSAIGKGNRAVLGTALSLPFKKNTFDLVYSFKVLPHVTPIERAIQEITRVLKPKGIAVLEFYNPWSIRGLIKLAFKPRLKISSQFTEREIYTRYDHFFSIRKLLERQYSFLGSSGAVTVFPIAKIYEWKMAQAFIRWAEKGASSSFLHYFSGFLMTAWKKY